MNLSSRTYTDSSFVPVYLYVPFYSIFKDAYLLNAFMASRGTLDVLESIPLNTLHDAHPPAKKRKTSHVAVGGPAGSAIVIRVGH